MLIKRRRLEGQVTIIGTEVDELLEVGRRLKNEIAAIDDQIALGQPDADDWPRYRRSEITISFIESRLLGRVRYCAYHRRFHYLDSFDLDQKLARPQCRYCFVFRNDQLREAMVPSMVMSDPNEVYTMAKLMRIRVIAHD